MSRAHGERQQDYVARRLIEDQRREVTAAHLSAPACVVEIVPWCGCSFMPYPHRLSEGRTKEVHDGPPGNDFVRMRKWNWKAAGLEYRGWDSKAMEGRCGDV
jgi:hypothetical protein